ncbi:MAG: chromosome segregation protein SMC [Clostridia bacterium]|nr:chromosome segregation protein SMC [Clostridia bacterium]
MFLKYLEIQGFKSFPDKITVELHSGITGIVGPNGSGKSNVSDAIRWVLGEQSAKTLRGGKMEDVIFSGTQERKPMGFAEVSVCFDNSDRHFKLDYDEVLVTRRYFRSGESEYYLNKTACRLRDIHELMMDTGMGRDGYSMVGQGRIDEIISAKPEDRRTIFEEAAGISKFRYRKQESERKMQQTGENLIRLLDIIGEIEGRLAPLERESAKAKEYLSLREELKENEISLSVYLLDDLKEKLSKTNELLKINQQDLEKGRQAIEDNEHNSLFLQENSRKIQNELDILNETTYSVKNEISAIENKISILNNSQAFNFENITRIKNEISDLNSKKEFAQNEISQTNDEIATFNNQLAELIRHLDELQNKILELSNNNADELTMIDGLNASILENLQLASEYKAEISSLNTLVETNKTRLLSIDEDIQIKEEDVEIAQRHLNQEEGTGKSILARLEKLQNNQKVAEDEYSKSVAEQNILFEKQNQLSNSLEQAKSREKMLADLERDMEGYSHSVKTVIQASERGNLQGVRLHSTVSSVLKVPSKYTTAIEVALGNAAQNIITETEDDAKKCIAFLKAVKGGRATFLPISAVKGRTLNSSEFEGNFGYIGLASELVSNDKKFDGIINELLGRTLVFETLDQAISFAKKEKYRFKLVTLEGEILATGGAITGGNLGKNSGFLSRKNQITEITDKIKELTKELDITLTSFENAKEITLQKSEAVKLCEGEVQLCQNELFRSNYNFEHYKNVLSEHITEYEELKKEKTELEQSFALIKQQVKDKEKASAECNKKSVELQESLKMLREKNSKNMTETASLNSLITKAQIDVANCENDIKMSNDKVVRLKLEIEEIVKQIELKDIELHSSDSEEGSYLKKIEEYELEISKLKENLVCTEDKIVSVKEKKTENEQSISDNANALKESNERVVALSQEQIRIENKLTRHQADFDSITNRMWEDYELTYISALPLKKEIENISECQKLVNGLKNKIRNLGNVNVSAIEEFSELKERYEFLTNQKNDLEEAKETLAKIIEDIETLMTKQFTEQLAIINEAFKKTFCHLFNGGTAELVLSDPDNVLTSGVEIVAQPPGKKLQNMTLFSGGEKAIIAISLLFAMLEVRPSPICILDEIEAALDDVNVTRFASYLRNISQRSQIAVITHRRGTMEEADRLYGVTMQEKGVSRLLQLNIDEIEQKILKTEKE